MTADAAFWGTQAALGLAIGLATAAAFLLGVMLFGTASRRRQQKIIGERMAAVGNRGRKVTHVQPDATAGGWIPARVTNFGRRFADARGFSGRLDAELEAADEPGARRLVELLALCLQGSLLVRHAPSDVADAFCATRLGGEGGRAYGTLPTGVDTAAVVERHRPRLG